MYSPVSDMLVIELAVHKMGRFTDVALTHTIFKQLSCFLVLTMKRHSY